MEKHGPTEPHSAGQPSLRTQLGGILRRARGGAQAPNSQHAEHAATNGAATTPETTPKTHTDEIEAVRQGLQQTRAALAQAARETQRATQNVAAFRAEQPDKDAVLRAVRKEFAPAQRTLLELRRDLTAMQQRTDETSRACTEAIQRLHNTEQPSGTDTETILTTLHRVEQTAAAQHPKRALAEPLKQLAEESAVRMQQIRTITNDLDTVRERAEFTAGLQRELRKEFAACATAAQESRDAAKRMTEHARTVEATIDALTAGIAQNRRCIVAGMTVCASLAMIAIAVAIVVFVRG